MISLRQGFTEENFDGLGLGWCIIQDILISFKSCRV